MNAEIELMMPAPGMLVTTERYEAKAKVCGIALTILTREIRVCHFRILAEGGSLKSSDVFFCLN